uniref:hypothetical protein n=1 Tax=Streptomyces sp. GSL17-113 TaxID=3115365 RepID=UPI002E78AD0A
MTDTAETRARRLLRRATAGVPEDDYPVTHSADLPARHARATDWPGWVPDAVLAAVTATGVDRPW